MALAGGPVMNMSGEVVGMVVGSLASDTGKSFVHALFAKCSSIRWVGIGIKGGLTRSSCSWVSVEGG